MLRLVDAAPARVPALRRVGLYGFEPELERYVLGALAARWPHAAVTRAAHAAELERVRLQLWLCAQAPPERTLSPVLWLDGIGTETTAARLAPRLWRLPAPVTAERLLQGVERVLRA